MVNGHVMCICLFVCLFVVICRVEQQRHVYGRGEIRLVLTLVCLFLFFVICFLLFVICFCYLVVCCHLLSGVACLWTWRNPGPHSCVNQSESEATFSVEKSATASIIRHLPPSLEIVFWFRLQKSDSAKNKMLLKVNKKGEKQLVVIRYIFFLHQSLF